MNNVTKGKLISIEGVDGAGKNTQTKLLKEYLESKGKEVVMFAFPQYDTEVGRVIAKYLRGEFGNINEVPNELICIAFAADRLSMAREIEDHLNNGRYVLIDRYTYSNLFTAAKLGEDKWQDFINWIEKLEFDSLKVVKPDYNLFLYVDPSISLERIQSRGKRSYQNGKKDIHEDNEKLLRDASKCYMTFADSKDDWFIVNEMKDGKQMSIKEVANIIREKIDALI